MKGNPLIVGFSLLIILGPPVGAVQHLEMPLTQVSYQKETNAREKSGVISKMRDVAKLNKLTIDESRLFYGSENVGLVACVPVAGIEKLKAEDFAAGKEVGVVYFSKTVSTSARKNVAPGTYVAKVVGDPRGPNYKAQLWSEGKLVVEVTGCNIPNARLRDSVTKPDRLGTWKPGERNENHRPQTGGAIVSRSLGFTDLSTVSFPQYGLPTTRCYGLLLFCRVPAEVAIYSGEWVFCGFCWGFWW